MCEDGGGRIPKQWGRLWVGVVLGWALKSFRTVPEAR